jgi:geranyl-CoA carboxylase alpha subunit
MNTRLQVEHPVTEIVTGTDLVDWQLKIAAGQPLPLTQDEITLSGHAIEARLYAENPAADFMPQTGSILSWRPPQATGIRVDDGIATPGEISPYYDSMVAKIIASGDTREQARRRLLQALESTSLLGVGTNRAFLVQLLEDDTFVAGNATTSYIDDRVLNETRELARPSAAYVALGLVALVRACDPQPNHMANWSNVAAIKRFKTIAVNDEELAVAYRANGAKYEVEIAGETVCVVVDSTSSDSSHPTGDLICQINGVRFEVPIAFDGERIFVSRARAELAIEDLSYRPVLSESAAGSGQIVATTEGQVVLVGVAEGDRVTAGQLLVVVEAMKMEHRHTADGDGVVTAVQVSQTTQVKKNQLLVSLELDGSSVEESPKS